MKANDLMIGDYVYIKSSDGEDTHIVKVKTIEESGINLFNGFIEFSELEPIPLTKEILKKNGFKTDGKNLILHYMDGIHESALYLSEMYMVVPPGYVTGTPNLLMKERPCNIDVFGEIHYVHDLQHLYKFRKIKKEIIL